MLWRFFLNFHVPFGDMLPRDMLRVWTTPSVLDFFVSTFSSLASSSSFGLDTISTLSTGIEWDIHDNRDILISMIIKYIMTPVLKGQLNAIDTYHQGLSILIFVFIIVFILLLLRTREPGFWLIVIVQFSLVWDGWNIYTKHLLETSTSSNALTYSPHILFSFPYSFNLSGATLHEKWSPSLGSWTWENRMCETHGAGTAP